MRAPDGLSHAGLSDCEAASEARDYSPGTAPWITLSTTWITPLDAFTSILSQVTVLERVSG